MFKIMSGVNGTLDACQVALVRLDWVFLSLRLDGESWNYFKVTRTVRATLGTPVSETTNK